MDCVEQIHEHVYARSLPRDRRPDEPEHGTRDDCPDPGVALIDSPRADSLVPRKATDLCPERSRTHSLYHCPACNGIG